MKHFLSTLFLALILISCTPEEPEPVEPSPTSCSTADCIITDLVGATLEYVAIEHDGILEPTDSSGYLVFTSDSTSHMFQQDGILVWYSTFITQGNMVMGIHATFYPIEGEEGEETTECLPWASTFDVDSCTAISSGNGHDLTIHYGTGYTTHYDRVE